MRAQSGANRSGCILGHKLRQPISLSNSHFIQIFYGIGRTCGGNVTVGGKGGRDEKGKCAGRGKGCRRWWTDPPWTAWGLLCGTKPIGRRSRFPKRTQFEKVSAKEAMAWAVAKPSRFQGNPGGGSEANGDRK